MRRPGFIRDYQGYQPRNRTLSFGFAGYTPFGMMPPRMGPLIPGPPSPSQSAPVPHPWSTGNVSRRVQRNCPSCK